MKHFKISEFDSTDKQGSGENMDETFLSMIDEAREIAKVPFIINSGYRTKNHNKKVGGKSDSAHLKGLAADIKCIDSRSRYIIVDSLKKVGFNRLGIAKSFIHCDIDLSKDKDVIWLY
jgi:uncharacterized protein YcbK (DUF882 family)